MEEFCPACCRFVVCDRKNEAVYRKWPGNPPAILEEDESEEPGLTGLSGPSCFTNG